MKDEQKPGYTATTIVIDGVHTRPYKRYNSAALATAAGDCEPDLKKEPDYLVITPATNMGCLSKEETAALRQHANVPAALDDAPARLRVREWLLALEPVHDRLTPDGEAERARLQAAPADEPTSDKPIDIAKETEMAKTSRKSGGKKAKKGGGKTAKKAAAKKAGPQRARPAKNHPLGREGTLTRFLCDGIVAKKDDEQLLAAARKKFPERKIGNHYVSWYRNKLKKDGVLK